QKCLVHAELLQSAAPDMFGAFPAAAAPGLTQEFQPYNPFSDEPVAAPQQPAPLDPNAAPAQPNPAVAEPFGSSPFEQPVTFGEMPQTPGPQAGHYDQPFGAGQTIQPQASPAIPPGEPPAPVVSGDPETQRISTAVAPVLEEFVAEI